MEWCTCPVFPSFSDAKFGFCYISCQQLVQNLPPSINLLYSSTFGGGFQISEKATGPGFGEVRVSKDAIPIFFFSIATKNLVIIDSNRKNAFFVHHPNKIVHLVQSDRRLLS
jgi:hypothetical protein